MSELKPCPFCGGAVCLCTANRGASFSVWCSNCGWVNGGAYPSRERAAEAWNHRPLEDELAAALKGLLEHHGTPARWAAAKDALAKTREEGKE